MTLCENRGIATSVVASHARRGGYQLSCSPHTTGSSRLLHSSKNAIEYRHKTMSDDTRSQDPADLLPFEVVFEPENPTIHMQGVYVHNEILSGDNTGNTNEDML